MTILMGIDEAGLGPILGPLAVSAAVFRVSDEDLDTSLWSLLAPQVSRKVSRKRRALAVADSKSLYSRRNGDGLALLERGVLSFCGAAAEPPASLRSWLEALCPEAPGQMDGYPWYHRCDLELPAAIEATDLDLSTNALRVAMRRRGMEFLGVFSEVVFPRELNRLFEATRNKSVAAFGILARLLGRLRERFGGEPCRLCVDRQGGRMHYRALLQEIYEGCSMCVLEENQRESAYRLEGPREQLEIRFCVAAEKDHLPVALASMASKYQRELCMTLFNRFWAGHVSGLSPTAGYHQDGRRFLREIAPAVEGLGVAEAMLLRSR